MAQRIDWSHHPVHIRNAINLALDHVGWMLGKDPKYEQVRLHLRRALHALNDPG